MTNTDFTPHYSLADLFRDINNGNVNEFQYNGQAFKVRRVFFEWIVTEVNTGFVATSKAYCNSMLDLQGMAACLMAEKRSIAFDKHGNFIS
jgi:hypothetical protein